LAAISAVGRDEKEDAMPTIVAHHNITKESKHWLTSSKRKEFFGPLGVTNIRTFVDPQNPNRGGGDDGRTGHERHDGGDADQGSR
jgi:hypothetical protein